MIIRYIFLIVGKHILTSVITKARRALFRTQGQDRTRPRQSNDETRGRRRDNDEVKTRRRLETTAKTRESKGKRRDNDKTMVRQ